MISLIAGVKSVYNGMGYCRNWGGGNGENKYPTVQSCANRCKNDFNSIAFTMYRRVWGYGSDLCECALSGQTCNVGSSSHARNYIITN